MASIGIIGGADGPTAIYLTASNMAGFGIYMLAVLAIAAVTTFLIHKRNSSK